MLFYSFFKSLVGKEVVVELKNDLNICGVLHSVDQYLNIKLQEISVAESNKHPHMSLADKRAPFVDVVSKLFPLTNVHNSALQAVLANVFVS